MTSKAGPEAIRIDELAHRTGVATTTIRLYQTRGLLSPPRLDGRTGYYDDRHIARLRLIGELRARGFSLAAIKALVDARDQGRNLGELFGSDDDLAPVFGGDDVILRPDELVARFPTGAIGPDEIQRVARLGLVAVLDDGRVRIIDRRFLDTGAALVHLGVPVDAVLDQLEHLIGQTDSIAARFIDVFERYLYDRDASADVLRNRLAELRSQAAHVVSAALEGSLARLGAERFAAELTAWESSSES
jgi:DNA-binding transcriptional MerR regulator